MNCEAQKNLTKPLTAAISTHSNTLPRLFRVARQQNAQLRQSRSPELWYW